MATVDQIAALRENINEPTDAPPYTNDYLNKAIDDAGGDVDLAASRIWSIKAGQYATLVDVTEAGSSRKLGDLQDNAQQMAAMYAGRSTNRVMRPTTRGISRA